MFSSCFATTSAQSSYNPIAISRTTTASPTWSQAFEDNEGNHIERRLLCDSLALLALQLSALKMKRQTAFAIVYLKLLENILDNTLSVLFREII